jgi:TetR/AcrR family fatty acid metabolism transcriptional regulator
MDMSKMDAATERKNQIVQATVECITKHGYHNFSMQDVARKAGVSKGIIHYYFLNKDDLMMSVLDKVASDIEKILQDEMVAVQDPLRKIEIFLEVSMDVVRNTREYYQVNMDFWTQINQKEAVRTVIATHYKKLRKTCERILQEGIEAGVFQSIDANEYASFIIALIDGISLQWLFDPSVFDYDNMCKKAHQLLMAGLHVTTP